jgi:hypothetical protein
MLTLAMRHRPLVVEEALLEDVLTAHRAVLGRDFDAYRGHVYRIYNFALAFAGTGAAERHLAVAAAFHDLGIWADSTFDYLAPSAERALHYARARGLDVDPAELTRIVMWHHKVLRYRGVGAATVEAFRRADWVDVSWGVLRFGLPTELLRDARRAFPNAGFHRCLLRVGWRWGARHPLRPLPVLRW